MQKTELNTQEILYVDFAKSLKVHPLTNDIILTKNELAIRESLINIMFTKPGERFYSDLGVGIDYWLFEPMTVDTTISLQNTIISNINKREPRVNQLKVNVKPDYDGNAYDIEVIYSLINSPKLFSVRFYLKRQR